MACSIITTHLRKGNLLASAWWDPPDPSWAGAAMAHAPKCSAEETARPYMEPLPGQARTCHALQSPLARVRSHHKAFFTPLE